MLHWKLNLRWAVMLMFPMHALYGLIRPPQLCSPPLREAIKRSLNLSNMRSMVSILRSVPCILHNLL
jgi:hypothetical protein